MMCSFKATWRDGYNDYLQDCKDNKLGGNTKMSESESLLTSKGK